MRFWPKNEVRPIRPINPLLNTHFSAPREKTHSIALNRELIGLLGHAGLMAVFERIMRVVKMLDRTRMIESGFWLCRSPRRPLERWSAGLTSRSS